MHVSIFTPTHHPPPAARMNHWVSFEDEISLASFYTADIIADPPPKQMALSLAPNN